jgi:hypothetical protein
MGGRVVCVFMDTCLLLQSPLSEDTHFRIFSPKGAARRFVCKLIFQPFKNIFVNGRRVSRIEGFLKIILILLLVCFFFTILICLKNRGRGASDAWLSALPVPMAF